MNANHLFNAGLKSARAGDYYGAVINLRLAASLGDESAEIHRLMGKAHVHLGELDQAEESFRRALNLDSRDGGAALCLATLRRCRIMRRTASATALIAAAAVVSLAFWFPWRAYQRLDASVAAISALNTSRPEAARRSESIVPAASRAETPPPATSQPSAATPSSQATGRMTTPLPTQTQSRAATPASPTAPGIATPPPTQTRPPAAPQIPPPRLASPQPDGAAAMFESRYKEAVGVAFKGDLKEALALLSALSGDEYAHQPLAGNVHFWMGRCLYELKQPREALDHFRRVLELYPNSPKYGEALIDLERCQRKLQTQ